MSDRASRRARSKPVALPRAEPIRAWHDEHRYFQHLLALLEKEVDVFHSGDRPSYERMRDILDYLQRFTHESHHRREDAAFACLARRSPGLQLPLARLQQEHRVVAHHGDRLRQSLEQAGAGAYLERADIEALAATYLVYYRSHIEREEMEILPHAARLLTHEDWREVARAAPESEEADARFRELRRQIEQDA